MTQSASRKVNEAQKAGSQRGRRKETAVEPPAPIDLANDRALNITQTAQYLGVGRPKVYDYIRDGLPTVKLSEGVRRVMLSSLIAWLKERETRGFV